MELVYVFRSQSSIVTYLKAMLPHVVDFRKAENENDLAQFIGVHPEIFKQVVSEDDRAKFYKKHLIPKRSGHRKDEHRVVWECLSDVLADVHKAFARKFELFSKDALPGLPHPAAYGYIRGRNIRENAQRHCKAPLLLRSDLKDFFPSISASRLESLFVSLGMKQRAAEILAKFATVDDKLALGLHASPWLANMVALPLDKRLAELASRHSCEFTRYADDLFFSGISIPTIGELNTEVNAEGFELSNRKTRITKIGQAHYVTGLSISDASPHVPRYIKRQIRQELYYCKKYGVLNHLGHIGELSTRHGINRLDGWVWYIAGIETRLKEKIAYEWNELLNQGGFSVSYEQQKTRPVRNIKLYFDESEIEFKGKKYLALACVALEETGRIEKEIKSFLEAEIKNPYSTSDKDELEKNGVHFSGLSEDTRTGFINVLANFPYRGYVVFAEIVADYESLYLDLLRPILERRFTTYDRSKMEIVYEQNSKISNPKVTALVKEIYESLQRDNNPRPDEEPKVRKGTKLGDPALAIPDSLLGVFSRYAKSRLSQDAGPRLRFENLRDKYRLIFDRDRGVGYSRKRAFEPW